MVLNQGEMKKVLWGRDKVEVGLDFDHFRTPKNHHPYKYESEIQNENPNLPNEIMD